MKLQIPLSLFGFIECIIKRSHAEAAVLLSVCLLPYSSTSGECCGCPQLPSGLSGLNTNFPRGV